MLARTSIQQARPRCAFDREQATKLAAARKGSRCPGCGETDNIEDNGERGVERTFRCGACHDQWDRLFGRED